jgi:hypothetical protein
MHPVAELTSLSPAEVWLKNASHRPWCNKAPDNIYSDGGNCNCGLEDAKAAVSKNKWKEIADQLAVAIQTFKTNGELFFLTLPSPNMEAIRQMNNALDTYDKANSK